MAAKKDKARQKSKAAQVTAAKAGERQAERWEDAVERMSHPETEGFRGRAEPAREIVRTPLDEAAIRRRSWIGGLVTVGFAVVAAIVAWLVTRR